LASAFASAYTLPIEIALDQSGVKVSSARPTLHSTDSNVRAEFLGPLPLTILVPVFNDWDAARFLVERLDAVFAQHALTGQIVFIDDGSLEAVPGQFPAAPPRNIRQIQSVENQPRAPACRRRWVCLEPDRALADRIKSSLSPEPRS
jgi:hypothetical protein